MGKDPGQAKGDGETKFHGFEKLRVANLVGVTIVGCRGVFVENGSSCRGVEVEGGRRVQQARGKGRLFWVSSHQVRLFGRE